MTGDDYVIALVYAYLQDYKAENLGKRSNEIRVVALDGGVNFTSVHLEAESNSQSMEKFTDRLIP